MPDDGTDTFEGIDLLDPTKLVPEELCPVVPIGMLTLNRNPSNYFAETEQVAFHVGHLVPGIEPTNDPLLHARLFSYLDTQLTRLGGPNFGQLPTNRPRAEVNDNLRDRMHQTQVHTGVAPYTPNSLGGGCPLPADMASAYVESRLPIRDAERIRGQAASFDDHLSQAALFFRSLTAVEQEHLVAAIAFELGKCHEESIRVREVGVLAQVDASLAAGVATRLGLVAPEVEAVPAGVVSPTLAQVTDDVWPVEGRVVGVVLAAGDAAGPLALCDALTAAGATVRLIAPRPGSVTVAGDAVVVERTYDTVRSIELDAVVLSEPDVVLLDRRVAVLADEAFRHAKPIVVVSDDPWPDPRGGAPGVLQSAPGDASAAAPLLALLGQHRVWDRDLEG